MPPKASAQELEASQQKAAELVASLHGDGAAARRKNARGLEDEGENLIDCSLLVNGESVPGFLLVYLCALKLAPGSLIRAFFGCGQLYSTSQCATLSSNYNHNIVVSATSL